MNINTNITGITLGILCGYSLYNIYNYISLQKKLDSCNHLLLTVIDMQRRNNNEIKTVNDKINALNDKAMTPITTSTRVSSPVTIIDTHPDDMFEELNHYFVTDEISKPITRTTLLTSAKNLLGL
jgi:hypothetical protein